MLIRDAGARKLSDGLAWRMGMQIRPLRTTGRTFRSWPSATARMRKWYRRHLLHTPSMRLPV